MWKLRVGVIAASSVFALATGTAAWASSGGNSNAGDVWLDNAGQSAGPGHEMDPHLACQDINMWGSGLADSSGSFTIDGQPPSGGKTGDYSGTWSYNQGTGGDQTIAVINVSQLISQAQANGDTPAAQGYHFKLDFSQDPQKHKTFWVNCTPPSGSTPSSTTPPPSSTTNSCQESTDSSDQGDEQGKGDSSEKSDSSEQGDEQGKSDSSEKSDEQGKSDSSEKGDEQGKGNSSEKGDEQGESAASPESSEASETESCDNESPSTESSENESASTEAAEGTSSSPTSSSSTAPTSTSTSTPTSTSTSTPTGSVKAAHKVRSRRKHHAVRKHRKLVKPKRHHVAARRSVSAVSTTAPAFTG
jgi:hypothetical protein